MDETTSESELLQASAAGNREAFGVIIRRYQSLVCAVTYSATGDVGASEELAQETFIRAWKNLKQLESPAKFRPWLCSIARNLTRSLIRTSRKNEQSLNAETVLPAAAPSPEQVASDKERQQIVWNAVGQIDPKYREPLVLYYRRGQSISEVAADLDLTEDTVRQRLYRGRQLIKSELSSLVEESLIRSGPGKAFAVAVVAALPAIVTPTASAAIAGVAAKGVPAAKTAAAAGLTGIALGPIIGLLGGVFGAWCGITNTKSPRERRFMIKMTVLLCAVMVLLLGVPMVLVFSGVIARSYYWVCFVAFFTFLVPFIFWANARQRRIQIEDNTYQQPVAASGAITKPGIYGSFSGSIFGPSIWLLVFAWLARDWGSLAAIIGGDIVLFLVATGMCVNRPQRYWSVALVSLMGLAVMTLAVLNLRWNHWVDAYRLTSSYNSINDVSLRTINLIVVAAYFALGLPMWWVWRTKRRQTDTK